MFDIMMMIKVLGGFCGVFLVFLLGGWVVEMIYYSEGGYGDYVSGYVIEVEIVDVGLVEVGLIFVEVFVIVDVGVGECVFCKCLVCYKLEDGVNGIGLYLWDIVDCEVVVVDGFVYLGLLVVVVQVWDVEMLNVFLEVLKVYVFGIVMNFNGLLKVEDCVNLIVYLQIFGG